VKRLAPRKEFNLKAYVDKETCIGCGLCPSICAEVFEMQDDGLAGVIGIKVPQEAEESAKEAEDGCPVNAISIE
jgi:ferredoxin